MKEKATSRVDAHGRIVIPAHIRKALSLETGDIVTIGLDPSGTIHVESERDRCCLCGKAADTSVTIGSGRRAICRNCAGVIRKAVK